MDHPQTEEALKYLFAARQEYIDAFYEQIKESFGDVPGFIHDGLKITRREVEEFKERILVS